MKALCISIYYLTSKYGIYIIKQYFGGLMKNLYITEFLSSMINFKMYIFCFSFT